MNEPSGIQTKPPYTYVHGQMFKADIHGEYCEGVVNAHGANPEYIYLDIKGSGGATKIFQRNQSWFIANGANHHLRIAKVKNLILYPF